MLTAPKPKIDHIRPLLWKNFLLKKKHPVKWALEILVPVAFIILMGALKVLIKDVKVPAGWGTDTTVPGDKTQGTGYNLYAVNSYGGITDPKFFTTELTMSGLLLNLAFEAYTNSMSMANFTLAQNLSCAAFVVQGKVNHDPSSPNAIPTACDGRIVPYKIAIVPDSAYTRQYFAETLSAWYPAVPMAANTSGLVPTIPAFADSVLFFADEAALEAAVKDDLYGKDVKHPRIHSAIVFNKPPSTSQIGGTFSIDYTIRMNSTMDDQGNAGDIPRTNVAAYDSLQKKMDTENYKRYATRGFMTLQTAVTRFALCQPSWTNGAPGNCTNTKTTAIKSATLDARLMGQLLSDVTLQKVAASFNRLPVPIKLDLSALPATTVEALVTPLRQAPQSVEGQTVYPFPIQGFTSSPFYDSISSFFGIIFVISYLFSVSSILVGLITEKEN
ncbi:ATP-binding Cassette (ABC) Superfamily, partial [Achlya hypogyna]